MTWVWALRAVPSAIKFAAKSLRDFISTRCAQKMQSGARHGLLMADKTL